MARVIRLDTTFTDTTLPLLRSDPILADGSLFLVDLAHPAGPWPAGVPADAALVPNLAQREARDVLADQAAEVRGVIVRPAGFTASMGLLERTPKGGMHGILSTVVGITGGLDVQLPTALRTYLAAHWDDALYASLWWRGTRVSAAVDATTITGVPSRYALAFTTSPAASYQQYLKGPQRRPTSVLGVFPAANTEAALDLLGNQRFSLARSGHNGTAPANASEVYADVGTWGKVGANTAGIASGNWTSWVLYRFYLENLTRSTRSYETVDAIDAALYTKHMSTAGGRYYGDTIPTDPATIP